MVERAYIIDDDEISVFLTSMLLETEGFARHIETYHLAKVALQRLQQLPEDELPQVIFLDLNMPELNGWEFLEKMLEQESRYLGKCLIFILTSSVDVQEKELAQKYKLVSGFIHKPLDQDILTRIKQVVNQPSSGHGLL